MEPSASETKIDVMLGDGKRIAMVVGVVVVAGLLLWFMVQRVVDAPASGSEAGRIGARGNGGAGGSERDRPFSLIDEGSWERRDGSGRNAEQKLTEVRSLIRTSASKVPEWLDQDYVQLTRNEQLAMCILVSKHVPKPLSQWYLKEVAGIEQSKKP